MAFVRRLPLFAFAIALTAAGLSGLGRKAHADADAEGAKERNERCATRLSIGLLGKSPSAALLANADPQSTVDGMLDEWAFVDRFSRFLNATFNAAPGDVKAADAPYYLAVKILGEKKPYKDLFVGRYSVVLEDPTSFREAKVVNDADGLGYFKSPFWMDRYAGNEQDGVRLQTAYRIQNNVVGLDLVASTAAPGQSVDATATGRQSDGCKGCHYEHWYALDKVAKVLGRVKLDAQGKPVMSGANNGSNKDDHIVFTAPEGSEQLFGKTVKNQRELVEALVASPAFAFNACRLAFKYLYGRAENTCEGPVFDRCVDAFTAAGTMQSAVATIAKDATFCQ